MAMNGAGPSNVNIKAEPGTPTQNLNVKHEVVDLASIENDIVRIIQNMNATEGIDMDTLTALTGAYSPLDRQNAVNSLLASKRIIISQGPEGLRLKLNDATQIAGSEEEQAIYTLIEESKTKGIWIRELRDGSGLSQLQLRKVLKNLESKKLIKTVKAVGTTKKCYMLYNLEPDTSLTGGTFYSEQQLDGELIQTMINVSVSFAQNRKRQAMEQYPDDIVMQKEMSYVKPQEIAEFIVQRRILNVTISLEDVNRILDIAVLDGNIERRNDEKIRASPNPQKSTRLVTIPCATCPVVDDCKPGNFISPQSCQYLTEWLTGVKQL